MPSLLREYPFSLLQEGVTANEDASVQLTPVLWADPQAPHWSQEGYRLFDEQGQPTSYLEGVVSRLMGLKQLVDDTGPGETGGAANSKTNVRSVA